MCVSVCVYVCVCVCVCGCVCVCVLETSNNDILRAVPFSLENAAVRANQISCEVACVEGQLL